MLSNNIKYLRERHGLTQAALADIVGVTDKAVSTWENGAYQPRMGAIEKMSKYFGVPKSVLLDTDIEADGQYAKQPATRSDELSKQLEELGAILDKLGEDERRELLRFAKFQASERSE